MMIKTKKERRSEKIAGCAIVLVAIIFSTIVLFAKRAENIAVKHENTTFGDSTVNLRLEDETTPHEATESDIATYMANNETETQKKEIYIISGTMDELEIQKKTFYPLTERNRTIIEQVVMAEAGSEPGAGIIALANCIYNAMLRCDGDLDAALIEYGYTERRKTPTTEVSECVSAVFDSGELLLDDDVLYFCRSDCESAETGWHSEQELVCTIGNHNFYKLEQNV